MKIQADKIESGSPYALQPRDLRRVLSALPAEWVADIRTIHLANTPSRTSAFFNRYAGRLTIWSRGASVADTLGVIFRELAAHTLGYRRQFGCRRSKKVNHRLEQIVQPYVDKVLPTFPPAIQRPEDRLNLRPIPPGFHPVHFPLENS